MASKRENYLNSRQRDFTRYAGMIGEEFRSKIDQLSKIIGDVHEPSVGSYRETLLRDCLRNYLPKRYSVGTGFVAFVAESERAKTAGDNVDLLNLKTYHVSSQLDVIVYDDLDYAPIFRIGDFVVVKPEAVRAVVEVKGSLKISDVNDSIEMFINFGKSWMEYNNFRSESEMPRPALLLMAWAVYIEGNGRSNCNGKSLRKTIVRKYQSILRTDQLDPKVFPLLSSAYIYGDCEVCLAGVAGEGPLHFVYSTERGRHVKYLPDGQPVLDLDRTISSLLAVIAVNLSVPFNPYFAYYDQSITSSVLPHEFAGHSRLVNDAAE